MTDTPRTPPDGMPLTLADAAVRLGISPDAARKRLERGTLHGEKRQGRWIVWLDLDAMLDAGLSERSESNRTPDAGRTPQDAAPDIAPLADLIATLSRENQELAAAAALWQERARFLGERLQALEAGPIGGELSGIPDKPQERDPGPVRDVAGVRAPEALQNAQGPAWRRLWRRVTGGG